jgi:hypothetical protein
MLLLMVSLLGCTQVAREFLETGAESGARGAARKLEGEGAQAAVREAAAAEGKGAAEVVKRFTAIAEQVSQELIGQGLGPVVDDVDLSGQWSFASQMVSGTTLRGHGERQRLAPGTYVAHSSVAKTVYVGDAYDYVLELGVLSIEVWGENIECYKVVELQSVDVSGEGLAPETLRQLESSARSDFETRQHPIKCDAVLQRSATLVETRDDAGNVTTERAVSR